MRGSRVAVGGHRYAVEIESLADFLTFVDREVTTALQPGTYGIGMELSHGNHWGGTVHGGLMRAVRVAYLDAQYDADANLASYLRARVAMRIVVQRLMDMYRTTEEMASLTTEQVLELFRAVAAERAESMGTVPRAI